MVAKKDPALRQRRGTAAKVVELVPPGPVAPPAAESWLPDTAAEWLEFWADEQLISVVRASHRPALVRLFDWRDRLRRAWATADALRGAVGDEHFTAGSTGQLKANPMYERAEKAEAQALQIEGRIEALEDRFGLTPGSLLKLGVDFQRRQSLEQANAKYREAVHGSSDAGAAPNDPRALPGDPAVGSS